MPEQTRTSRDSAAELTQQGYELIEAGQFDEALAVSGRLQEMHYSSSFEIAALAVAGKGEVERAVHILEEGVTRAPDVWLNWQLLGNYRSDLGRYAAAETAYQRALACRNVDLSSVRLNQAVLAHRMEKPADALSLLEEVVDTSLSHRIAVVKGGVLRDLGRAEEAWHVVNGALETVHKPQDSDSETFGDLRALSARIMLDRGEPRTDVRQALVQSLGIVSHEQPILEVIREIDGCTSPDARYFRLLLDCSEADEANPDQRLAYFIRADVVANNADEAVSFVAQLFGSAERWKCVVDESKILEQRPNELKGVYRTTKKHYYDPG